MDFEILKFLGQIGGIGGVALGVFLLLTRDILRKKIFQRLTKKQTYSLLRLISILAWSIGVLGIIAWFLVSYLKDDGRIEPSQTEVEKPPGFMVAHPFPILPDPTFEQWLKVSKAEKSDPAARAYDLFLEAKHVVENSDLLNHYPRTCMQDDECDEIYWQSGDQSSAGSIKRSLLLKYEYAISAYSLTEQSKELFESPWTEFYQGILLYRFRMFKPAQAKITSAIDEFRFSQAQNLVRACEIALEKVQYWEKQPALTGSRRLPPELRKDYIANSCNLFSGKLDQLIGESADLQSVRQTAEQDLQDPRRRFPDEMPRPPLAVPTASECAVCIIKIAGIVEDPGLRSDLLKKVIAFSEKSENHFINSVSILPFFKSMMAQGKFSEAIQTAGHHAYLLDRQQQQKLLFLLAFDNTLSQKQFARFARSLGYSDDQIGRINELRALFQLLQKSVSDYSEELKKKLKQADPAVISKIQQLYSIFETESLFLNFVSDRNHSPDMSEIPLETLEAVFSAGNNALLVRDSSVIEALEKNIKKAIKEFTGSQLLESRLSKRLDLIDQLNTLLSGESAFRPSTASQADEIISVLSIANRLLLVQALLVEDHRDLMRQFIKEYGLALNSILYYLSAYINDSNRLAYNQLIILNTTVASFAETPQDKDISKLMNCVLISIATQKFEPGAKCLAKNGTALKNLADEIDNPLLTAVVKSHEEAFKASYIRYRIQPDQGEGGFQEEVFENYFELLKEKVTGRLGELPRLFHDEYMNTASLVALEFFQDYVELGSPEPFEFLPQSFETRLKETIGDLYYGFLNDVKAKTRLEYASGTPAEPMDPDETGTDLELYFQSLAVALLEVIEEPKYAGLFSRSGDQQFYGFAEIMRALKTFLPLASDDPSADLEINFIDEIASIENPIAVMVLLSNPLLYRSIPEGTEAAFISTIREDGLIPFPEILPAALFFALSFDRDQGVLSYPKVKILSDFMDMKPRIFTLKLPMIASLVRRFHQILPQIEDYDSDEGAFKFSFSTASGHDEGMFFSAALSLAIDRNFSRRKYEFLSISSMKSGLWPETGQWIDELYRKVPESEIWRETFNEIIYTVFSEGIEIPDSYFRDYYLTFVKVYNSVSPSLETRIYEDEIVIITALNHPVELHRITPDVIAHIVQKHYRFVVRNYNGIADNEKILERYESFFNAAENFGQVSNRQGIVDTSRDVLEKYL